LENLRQISQLTFLWRFLRPSTSRDMGWFRLSVIETNA
jgi:hypothetical protein